MAEKPSQCNVSQWFVLNYHVIAAATYQHLLLRLVITCHISVFELFILISHKKKTTTGYSCFVSSFQTCQIHKKKKSTNKSLQHQLMFVNWAQTYNVCKFSNVV